MNPTTKKSNCENNNKIEEIKKLRKRIKVLRDSIKLSSSSLATIQNPHQTWKENTLFAVSNCIGNWRSIVLYYDLFLDDDENDIAHHNEEEGEVVVVEEAALTIDQEIEQMVQRVRGMNDEVEVVGDVVESTVPREIFELIQMSLQSGPLTGGKPGYFKRCGSEIAEMASDFLSSLDLGLDDAVDDDTEDEAITTTTVAQNRTNDFQYDKQRCLGMSMNQFQTICKWYKNAIKAVESGAQPSKSMSKRMNQNYKPLKNNGSNSHKRKKKKKYLRPSQC